MDSEKDGKDFNVTKMRHFAKLHERIQNKYNEMQRKIEKSKSVDSLMTTDDYLFKDNEDNMKCLSTNDLTDDVFVDNGNNDKEETHYPLMHTVIVEDVNKIEVTYTNIDPKEVSFAETETNNTEPQSSADVKSENTHKDSSEYIKLSDDIKEWIMDNDSLLGLDTSGAESTSTSANPRLSLRNKIGSRLSAVRERRRESKEKKLLQKKVERESRELMKRKSSELLLSKSDKLLFSSSKSEALLRDKRFKVATVTIALIEVTGLRTELTEERRNLQCRFKLGIEKYKTKHIRHVATTTNIVKWQELFNLNMYDEYNTQLEISLLDTERKDMVIGKTTVELSELEKEKTHAMKLPLEGVMGNAEVFALLTITGTPYVDLFDFDYYNESQARLESDDEEFRYFRLDDFSKVGRLSVIVYGAKGLALPDCYCTLKLINDRRQTHTGYKTNEPNWMKSFVLVTDITSILEIFVKDERRDEDVGRVIIPLLQIRNGEKVWYALKDETLRERANGHNPRILLEMKISWNIIKASVKVIKPKEVDFLEVDEKFDRKLFFKNIARSKTVMFWTLDFLKLLRACFEWESRKWNTICIVFWLLFNWFFSPWMVPLLLIIPFVWYRPPNLSWNRYMITQGPIDKENRKSLWQRINNFPDLIYSVQKLLGKLASFGESVKNLFNFTVPYISLLAIFFLVSISLIAYLIPVKYIFMGWGIKKYVRKIIWPNRVSHSEVLDLISRIPDDEVLIDCEMLLPESKTNLLEKVEEDELDDLLLYEEEKEKQMQNFEGI